MERFKNLLSDVSVWKCCGGETHYQLGVNLEIVTFENENYIDIGYVNMPEYEGVSIAREDIVKMFNILMNEDLVEAIENGELE